MNTIKRLESLCNKRDIERIIKYLNHNDDEIRKASLLCLLDLNDKKAIKSIETLLKTETDQFVVHLAKNVLSEIKQFGIPEPIDINRSKVKLKKENNSKQAYNLKPYIQGNTKL